MAEIDALALKNDAPVLKGELNTCGWFWWHGDGSKLHGTPEPGYEHDNWIVFVYTDKDDSAQYVNCMGSVALVDYIGGTYSDEIIEPDQCGFDDSQYKYSDIEVGL